MKIRINGTKNIAKITKSMKMVSAAKLRGDQQRLTIADPFAVFSRVNIRVLNLSVCCRHGLVKFPGNRKC